MNFGLDIFPEAVVEVYVVQKYGVGGAKNKTLKTLGILDIFWNLISPPNGGQFPPNKKRSS